jgi:hypothetical protein
LHWQKKTSWLRSKISRGWLVRQRPKRALQIRSMPEYILFWFHHVWMESMLESFLGLTMCIHLHKYFPFLMVRPEKYLCSPWYEQEIQDVSRTVLAFPVS